MGRREKEIITTNAALRDLVEWLRGMRVQAGLSYRELADRVGLHATTLQRVASGGSIPKLMPVLAYARGCDAQPEDARRLWQKARREHVRSGTQHRQQAPAPAYVRDFADLSAALRGLYEGACAPPLRVMEQRAGKHGQLPRSSAHRIVNKETVPRSLQQFQAFLRACEVPAGHWKEWEDAWSRAWRFEKQEDAGLNEVLSNDPRRRDQPLVWFSVDETERDLLTEVKPSTATVTTTTVTRPQYRPLVPRQRAGVGGMTLREALPDAAQRGDRPSMQVQLFRARRVEATVRRSQEMGPEPLLSLPPTPSGSNWRSRTRSSEL